MPIRWLSHAQPFALLLLVFAYTWLYGTKGINETDGGFLTGLAWQLLNGKALYADVVYVRPPLPVWQRAFELMLLPEAWAVLGERLIFYLKVAAYSALGAFILLPAHPSRWAVALFAFVLSAHHYPAMAWHTVDGLFWGALGLWVLFRHPTRWSGVLAGVLLAASMLCKQSFYPIATIGVGVAAWRYSWRYAVQVGLGLALGWAAFAAYLQTFKLWDGFWQMTTGATSLAQAVQHGGLDYFRIHPAVALLSMPCLAAAWWLGVNRPHSLWALRSWVTWWFVLGATYLWSVFVRHEFTVPFAQLRLLFWVANTYALWQWHHGMWSSHRLARYTALVGLSWCAAVSWGYNLPILFSVPWIFALWDATRRLGLTTRVSLSRIGLPAFVGLFAVFAVSGEWVYRDGRRSDMTMPLGDIFPALTGICSTPQKAALYSDLARLMRRYGPEATVLPAFPQANFLTQTSPPLPLDWVVSREMGRYAGFVEAEARRRKAVFFLEKTALPALDTDPELTLVKQLYDQGKVLEETPFFRVFCLP